MNFESDVNPDEGNIMDSSNVSMFISKKVENTILMIKSNKPSSKIVRLSAKTNGISQNALYSSIEEISKHEDSRLREVLRLILVIFLVENKYTEEDINSSKFMLVSLKTYSKSNTKEPDVVKLKDLLDNLLEDYSFDYNKTQRVATKTNFKKALFVYIVTAIQISK